jgi:hypothetical protein
MSNARKLILLTAVIIVMLVIASLVRSFAASKSIINTDHTVTASDYQLAQTVNDDLVVIADTLALSGDSRVNGDAALISRGAAQVSGRISGDVTAMSSAFTLNAPGSIEGDLTILGGSTAIEGTIGGDLTVLGGTLMIGPESRIKGDIYASASEVVDKRPDKTVIAPLRQSRSAESMSFLRDLNAGRITVGELAASSARLPASAWLFTLSWSLLLTGIAALAVTLFPRRFAYMQEAILSRPRNLSGVGCMTLLLAAGISALLVFIIAALPPVGLILALPASLAALAIIGMAAAGWIALALLLGDWLLRRYLKLTLPPLVAAVLGSAVLFLIYHLLAFIPFGGVIGLIGWGVLVSVGLGSALVTRVGTRPLRQTYFVQG